MDLETFLYLPTIEVAHLVRQAGPKVCVFPINGTRRWFMLEYPDLARENFSEAYLEINTQRPIELYKLLFDHGVDTLLTPIFGPDLLERGEAYVAMVAEGMARLGTHPDFLDFYRDYDVRVRFYGDYRKFLEPTPYGYVSSVFEETVEQTRSHDRHRLFFGAFAHDAAETLAQLSVSYYQEHGRIPDKRALVTLYYGEYVPPVDFFIGFDKFSAFDMPLVSTGEEDLYFTVAPSPYLTVQQLRRILHDHIYVRPEADVDYSDLTPEDWSLMRDFYRANLGHTQGIGARKNPAGFWYPLPQVKLPEGLKTSS
ncbi:MAG TPA: diterpene synthase [Chloroflexi bacterium]|nr:diterpene synthase [Chloroflexota bacterium]